MYVGDVGDADAAGYWILLLLDRIGVGGVGRASVGFGWMRMWGLMSCREQGVGDGMEG